MESDPGLFRTLLEQKEKEIISLCEHQMSTLQQQVADKSTQYKALVEKFEQLQEDFKYNLALLDDRDAELAQYDTSISSFQEAAKEREQQYQNSRTALAEAHAQIQQEKARIKEVERLYAQKLKEIQDQMQNLRMTKEELQSKQRHAFEATREELMRQVLQKQEQLDVRSKDIEAKYFDQLQNQKLQHQIELDEAVNKLFDKETRVKELERDLEAGRARELTQKNVELELNDVLERKDKQVKELLSLQKQLQHEMVTMTAEHDKRFKKVSETMETLEDQHASALSQKDALLRASELEIKSLEAELASCEADKHEQIKRFKERVRHMEAELITLEAQEEGRVRELRRRQEQQLQNMRSEALNWKAEHETLLSKYSDVQKQLAAALTREAMLQAELAEARRVHKEEVVIFSEPLPVENSRLQTGKRRSNSVISLETHLPAPSPLLSPISTEEIPRHVPKNRLGPPQEAELVGLQLEKEQLQKNMEELTEQNERLRSVLGVMRKEMEAMQKAAVIENNERQPVSSKPEVDVLHHEIDDLRSQTMAIAAQVQVLHEARVGAAVGGKIDQAMTSHLHRGAAYPNTTLDRAGNSFEAEGTRPRILALESENMALQSRLQVAHADLLRIEKERDQLMELSNSLRADLNRLTPYGQGVISHDNVGANCGNAGPPVSRATGKSNELSPDQTRSAPDRTRNWVQNVLKTRPDPVPKPMQLQGTSTVTHERRQGSEYDTLHKGTASQLLWFKSAVKRREDGSKVKVRNYNIKDEEC